MLGGLEHLKKRHAIYSILEKRSFRGILIFSFVFVSIIPILALQYLSYNRLRLNLQENMNRLSVANVAQIRNNLQITMDAYNDLLKQISTNDEAVLLVNSIDNNINKAVAENQLRRMLHRMCYAKDGIEAISIITQGGNVIFYDKITASIVNSSWLSQDDLSSDVILEKVLNNNATYIFPTNYASNMGVNPNYLFHMAHRIIDYKQIEKNVGVVVLSLNEDILKEVYNSDLPLGTLSFIVDKSGRIISYTNTERIGEVLPDFDYKSLLYADGYLTDNISIYSTDVTADWTLITAVDQSAFHDEIASEQKNMLVVGVITLTAATMLIFIITTLLTHSMKKVTDAMKRAQSGDLDVSVSEEHVFSSEMLMIVQAFNEMMLRIISLIEEVRSVSLKQKNAEIKALEAQINPHFLYNTLDSMNWIAIDNDQFEVSNMITSLAKILRYSINNSNEIVTLKEEIEWLRQYMYLYQMRSKNSFDYNLNIDENVLLEPIHKLILQPFVENSIIHGFKNIDRKKLLSISAVGNDEAVQIIIKDNGQGIKPSVLEDLKINSNTYSEDSIGMKNAMGRIKMYYGERSKVIVESELGIGTTVTIILGKGIGV